MPRGERQTINFDLSDDEQMSASENQKREAEVRAEARGAVESARSDQKNKDHEELRGLLNELQGEQDVFQLAKESEREPQRLTEKDIEVISEEEANIAEAIRDQKKAIAKTPPPIPAAALQRPTPRSSEPRPVTSLEDARAAKTQKSVKKSVFSRITNLFSGKKAA